MFAEHGEEMTADFQQFYNLNLFDLWRLAEFERIRVLTTQLPRESRLMRALNPQLEWGEEAYLLANIFDQLAAMCAPKGKKPKQHPRPKAKKKQPQQEKKTLDVSDGRIQNLLFAPRK